MKVISYSIFGDPDSFEFPFYLRGLYFNARMNKLIYPDWKTWVSIEEDIYDSHRALIDALISNSLVQMVHLFEDAPLCESMLWRMCPMFFESSQGEITHVICRDADAITTYKEAQAVQEWIDSGLGFHGITDNPAHSLPMMGGMVGFKVDHFKAEFPQWTSFEEMIKGQDLSKRGSDQDFMMKKIYPFAKPNMMGHFFDGCRENVKITRHTAGNQIPGVDPKLWESNLTCRHIGSPGVVDFETLRFFQRFDKTDYSEFEKQFPQIFYWAR
jgi:hypothetical protein